MADRFVLKQFAGSATNNGAFGAAQATGAGVQPVANIKDVQSLAAFEQGWDSATLTADKLPALEEMQGLEALLCKAIKELYSEGIPLWISGETYYQYSFVNYNGVIYYNTTGSYTANNPAIDTANWSEYKPSAAGVADKLGTATVGNETIPIYLDNGTATPCKQTAITVYANVKTYSLNEVVMTLDTNNNVKLYKSLANNNTSALSDDTKWEEVSLEDLANKADIDASNFNATGKTTIVGWGMPDYSAGIAFSPPSQASPFTAPTTGLAVIYIPEINALINTLYINNIPTSFRINGTIVQRDLCSISVPLSEGDVIYFDTSSFGSNISCGFYPCKGVN